MPDSPTRCAPGWPGIPPRWTSSAKTGAGTALNQHSKVWFTLSHGILNEVYFPRVDQACTRDMGFIVTNGFDFFSEEKRHCTFENQPVEAGIPAFELINTDNSGRYRIHKEVLTDPYRSVVLQKIRFEPTEGQLSDYHLYAVLSPHLANCGYGNTGWIGDYKGYPMFFAAHHGVTLSFASSAPWKKTSVGFVGASDGWQDLSQHFQMEWEYTRAENGNIAFTGEIDLAACNGQFVLALGFGAIWTEAGQQARSTLFEDYADIRQHYIAQWKNWHTQLLPLDEPLRQCDLYRASTAVLRTHESKDFLGGIIASLSIPWGFNKGDEDLGGYHLVWPRDLVETRRCPGGRRSGHRCGARACAIWKPRRKPPATGRRTCGSMVVPTGAASRWMKRRSPYCCLTCCAAKLRTLWANSNAGGRWCATPPAFILRNGPVTQQDRWEEDAGYSPFTLAAEISALLAAADIAELTGHSEQAATMRDAADAWNDNIERWVYATGGDLARTTRHRWLLRAHRSA